MERCGVSVTRIVATIISALSLVSCAVGPDYERPQIDTGAGWSAGTVEVPPGAEPESDLAVWWRSFDEPTLNRLVESAIAQNLELRQAELRVTEVRALRDSVAAGRWPVVGISAGVAERRQSENGPIPIDQIPGLDRDQTIYETGFDAAWEFSLAGGTRRAVEAADARLTAALEQQRGAQMRVAAETARSYFELRGAQHERDAVRAGVEASRASTDLVRRQLAAGEVSEASLARAEASLAAVESSLPLLDARVRVAALSIGVLLGDLPESEADLAQTQADYVALRSLPVGQRADLLRRRPDVRAAERALAAATAEVGVATAELFPKIGFGANAGFQSLAGGDLFESASETFLLAPVISWQIFSGGRVRATIRANEARVEIAALEYEKAVKTALSDAERALTRYRLGLAALERQRAAVAAARRSYGFSGERYRAGDISLLELLAAEQGLREAQQTYARTHTAAATDLVALYKALGGGWPASDDERQRGAR
jgi:NodT family efflux transporter outer membrane factor (OMF) lipoprotein